MRRVERQKVYFTLRRLMGAAHLCAARPDVVAPVHLRRRFDEAVGARDASGVTILNALAGEDVKNARL